MTDSPDRSRLQELGRTMDDSEVQLDLFFQLSHDLFAIANGDGFLKRVNARWTEVLGYPEPQLLGTPFMEFIHPDDRERTKEVLERLRVGPVSRFINRYLTATGEVRIFEWNATKYTDEGFTYATARDITEMCESCPQRNGCQWLAGNENA